MTIFNKTDIVQKLAQCLGMEKSRAVLDTICDDIGLTSKTEFSSDEMVQLCDRMEMEGGFFKMMASVLKIQAIMDHDEN